MLISNDVESRRRPFPPQKTGRRALTRLSLIRIPLLPLPHLRTLLHLTPRPIDLRAPTTPAGTLPARTTIILELDRGPTPLDADAGARLSAAGAAAALGAVLQRHGGGLHVAHGRARGVPRALVGVEVGGSLQRARQVRVEGHVRRVGGVVGEVHVGEGGRGEGGVGPGVRSWVLKAGYAAWVGGTVQGGPGETGMLLRRGLLGVRSRYAVWW